uniref:Uncharacterized protein n=1 Tax=Candidatus Kentrum sp. LPFa TaxID=2126335 RepID=A0A450VV95_9GAMM|nr:MAG: hypothetical protein BECKLPF1236B_GA0070989_10041 [Candidatus Kentron sp. LPFa]
MPERGTSVNGGNRPPRGNGEGVAQASSLPNTCSLASQGNSDNSFIFHLASQLDPVYQNTDFTLANA